MDDFIIGAVIAILVLILWAAFTAFAGLLFMWAWNFVMPVLWHGAPHITWLQAVAVGFLIGFVKGLFSLTFNHKTES